MLETAIRRIVRGHRLACRPVAIEDGMDREYGITSDRRVAAALTGQ